jgi:dipeptidyl aminopeptidase/acylaminoacyl peptidase
VLAGRFEMEALIGAGAMGDVYRGRDRTTGQAVAVKMVHALDERALRRFEREAGVLADLEHPGIVRYVAHGIDEGGAAFLVMERLVGHDLAARLQRGRLTEPETLSLGRQVAEALAAAHARGVVHRDIKPSNIFLCGGRIDDARILDFGLARTASAGAMRTPSTHSGALIGTVGYIAPEQARGAGAAEPRSDLFSLGCVLFECVTTTRAFTGRGIEALAKMLMDPAPRLRSIAADLSPALEELVAQLLAKAPAGRPPSASWVAEELARIAAGGKVRTTSHLTARPRARTAGRWTRIGPVFGIVIALGSVAFVLGHRTPARDTPALTAAVHETPAPPTPLPLAFHPHNPRRVTFGQRCAEFPTFTPDATALIYDATVGDSSFLFEARVADGKARQLTTVTGWDMAPALSPDGSRIAFLRIADGKAALFVMDHAKGATPRRIAEGDARPSWSRDGQSIWAGDRRTLERRDSESGALLDSIALPPGVETVRSTELADGSLLVVAGGEVAEHSGMALYDRARTLRWLWRGAIEEVLAVVPGTEHALTAVLRPGGERELYDVPLNGAAVSPLPSPDLLLGKGLTFSSDGRRVAWSSCEAVGALRKLRPDGSVAALDDRWTWDERDIAAIPGSRESVVVSARAGRLGLWVAEMDGPRPSRAPNSSSVRDPDPPRALPTSDVTPFAVSVSDDGEWAVFSAAEGGLRVVALDGQTPARPVTLTQNDTAPSFLRASHDVIYETPGVDAVPHVLRVSIDGGEPAMLIEGSARAPAPSPVDDRIAYLAGDRATDLVPMVFDRATSRSAPLSTALGPGMYRELRFSSDGRRVAVLRRPSVIVDVDAATGRVLRSLYLREDASHLVFWHGSVALVVNQWAGDVWVGDDPL